VEFDLLLDEGLLDYSTYVKEAIKRPWTSPFDSVGWIRGESHYAAGPTVLRSNAFALRQFVRPEADLEFDHLATMQGFAFFDCTSRHMDTFVGETYEVD
jgi:hypothetical protein